MTTAQTPHHDHPTISSIVGKIVLAILVAAIAIPVLGFLVFNILLNPWFWCGILTPGQCN